METTRHFTATVYLVNDGATALHRHPRLGIRIPPGGHVDRDELPHEAALREAREETGLEPTLVDDTEPVEAPAGETLPTPRHTMLYDINVHEDGTVGHQHVDSIYFASADARAIDPAGDDEVGADGWEWYTPAALRESDVDSDTTAIGIEAIETVGAEHR
ncbi:NUDIX hydrolase [Halobaculum litoreum]|uniref:NUDIX hydrolase n=1 Tax=Halobaculum litoreum TaxID=3031998 RepID=A0ABD5XSW4_9EURY|nr:NUDIX domain-containing protein [Halobaculum sp. DT92]